MAALHGRQFMAPFTLNGNCDALVFETYLEKFLLPEKHGGFPIKNKIRQLLDLGESIDNATLRVLKQSYESI